MQPTDLLQILEDIAATELDPATRTVLVVEDDPDLRAWLAGRLAEDGLVVATAERGRTALQHIAEKAPRVVVTDKNIPDFSGVELIRRGKAASPSTAFLLVTGDATLDSAIEAVNLGAIGYIRKPITSVGDVLRRVTAGLERQRVALVNGILEERLRSVESELLTTRIELSTMDEVVRSSLRERARLYRQFIDELIGPLAVVEDDVANLAHFADSAARGEVPIENARRELGRLKMLEGLVRRMHHELITVAERLELEAAEARSPIAPHLHEP